MSKIYTGVGGRETPTDVQSLMEAYANHLAVNGWTLRSGAAKGADQAFERGVHAGSKEIYLPWEGFSQRDHDPSKGYFVSSQFENWNEAVKIAANTHPNWSACKQGAQKLHARNVYQVLGKNLDTPSDALIFWAPVDQQGRPKGGTATAVNIAISCGIPCQNLFYSKNRDIVMNIIQKGLMK